MRLFSTARAATARRTTRPPASLIATLAAAAMFATVAAPAAHADEYCPPGYVCVFNGEQYQGAKKTVGAVSAEQPIVFETTKRSIKNRTSTRAVWTLKIYAGAVIGWDCVNAGDQRRGDGTFWTTLIYIGAPNTRC